MNDIHPSAVIDDGVKLGTGNAIGPNCVIGCGAVLGNNNQLLANVNIGADTTIGDGNRFFPNCMIGGEPQVLALSGKDDMGLLAIGDNNVFREMVTIHPSMHKGKYTRIGSRNFIMVGAHIGHDCLIEDDIVMSNYVQISGHCNIQRGVWLSGVVVIHQFVTVGRWAYATGLAGINHDVPPFMIISGHYPPRVRGINKRGLGRAGLTEQQGEKIFQAYKCLYRSKGTLLENAKTLKADDGLDENVRDIVDAIIRSSGHRFGRYLEQFRD